MWFAIDVLCASTCRLWRVRFVSGPTLSDTYLDSRNNYQGTEVAIDYQTGLVVRLLCHASCGTSRVMTC